MLFALANLQVCVFQPDLQGLDLLFGFFRLGFGQAPGILQDPGVAHNNADLAAADGDFFVQSLLALALLAQTGSQIGALFAQNLNFFLDACGLLVQSNDPLAIIDHLPLRFGDVPVQRSRLFAQIAQLTLS